MRWLWRKIKGLIRFFFGGVEADSAPQKKQEKKDGVETPGVLGRAKQKLHRMWTWLTSILNAILLPDKIRVALQKAKAASAWAKTNWKSAKFLLHNPKLLLAKLHAWGSWFWHALGAWLGKVAGFASSPTALAVILILICILFAVMRGHPPTA